MKPAITIVIPAYNSESTLARCLDSVTAQDFTPLEVIIVNDGSTDFTAEIAKKYQIKADFKFIDQSVNTGVASARWAGVSEAEGEYIAFVDSDDYIAPDMMSKMYNKAKSTGADVVVCGAYRVKANAIIKMFQYEEVAEDSFKAIKKIIYENNDGSLWNKLLKKDLISEDDYIKTKGITYCEDMVLLVQAIGKAKIVAYINEFLYYYVENPHSVTYNPGVRSLSDLVKAHSIIFNQMSDSKHDMLKLPAKTCYISNLILAMRYINRLKNGPEVKKLRRNTIDQIYVFSYSEIINIQKARVLLDFFLIKIRMFDIFYSVWDFFRINLSKNFNDKKLR